MGQIKNIKLHIVTDIKDPNHGYHCREEITRTHLTRRNNHKLLQTTTGRRKNVFRHGEPSSFGESPEKAHVRFPVPPFGCRRYVQKKLPLTSQKKRRHYIATGTGLSLTSQWSLMSDSR